MKSKIAVLAVDPGKSTGVCLITWGGIPEENPVVEISEEVSPEDFAESIKKILALKDTYGSFRVACERFTITTQTGKNSQAPFSLEQIGVLKHLCREDGMDVDSIAFQAPVDAKNMFPNPTLQKLGTWHRGGEGHANDAIRHGLLCLIKMKWVPLSLLADTM
jgi:hypothetical protein